VVSRLVGRHGEMRFFCSASLRLSSWPTSAAQFLADSPLEERGFEPLGPTVNRTDMRARRRERSPRWKAPQLKATPEPMERASRLWIRPGYPRCAARRFGACLPFDTPIQSASARIQLASA
jgi:hypothetical protein